MTETTNQNIFQFQPGTATIQTIIAAVLFLTSGILAAVALGADWATYDLETDTPSFGGFGGGTQQVAQHYGAFELGGGGGSAKYTDDGYDDQPGIGMMRAGGPLVLTGMIVAFVALPALVLSAFLTPKVARMLIFLVAPLAFVLLMVGTILLPLGIGDFHSQVQAQLQSVSSVDATDAAYTTGLVLTIIASVLSLGGSVLAGLGLRSTPADNAGMD